MLCTIYNTVLAEERDTYNFKLHFKDVLVIMSLIHLMGGRISHTLSRIKNTVTFSDNTKSIRVRSRSALTNSFCYHMRNDGYNFSVNAAEYTANLIGSHPFTLHFLNRTQLIL